MQASISVFGKYGEWICKDSVSHNMTDMLQMKAPLPISHVHPFRSRHWLRYCSESKMHPTSIQFTSKRYLSAQESTLFSAPSLRTYRFTWNFRLSKATHSRYSQLYPRMCGTHRELAFLEQVLSNMWERANYNVSMSDILLLLLLLLLHAEKPNNKSHAASIFLISVLRKQVSSCLFWRCMSFKIKVRAQIPNEISSSLWV